MRPFATHAPHTNISTHKRGVPTPPSFQSPMADVCPHTPFAPRPLRAPPVQTRVQQHMQETSSTEIPFRDLTLVKATAKTIADTLNGSIARQRPAAERHADRRRARLSNLGHEPQQKRIRSKKSLSQDLALTWHATHDTHGCWTMVEASTPAPTLVTPVFPHGRGVAPATSPMLDHGAPSLLRARSARASRRDHREDLHRSGWIVALLGCIRSVVSKGMGVADLHNAVLSHGWQTSVQHATPI